MKYITPATIAGLGAAIAVISAGIAAAPATGGLSFIASSGAVATISAQTGLGVGAIIIAVSIGITLLIAIFKDYDLIELKNGDSSIRLQRKNRETKGKDEGRLLKEKMIDARKMQWQNIIA